MCAPVLTAAVIAPPAATGRALCCAWARAAGVCDQGMSSWHASTVLWRSLADSGGFCTGPAHWSFTGLRICSIVRGRRGLCSFLRSVADPLLHWLGALLSALRDDAVGAVAKLDGSKFQGGRTLRVAIARRRRVGSDGGDGAPTAAHVDSNVASEASVDRANAGSGRVKPTKPARRPSTADGARRKEEEAEKLKTVMIWGLAADFPVARLRKRSVVTASCSCTSSNCEGDAVCCLVVHRLRKIAPVSSIQFPVDGPGPQVCALCG